MCFPKKLQIWQICISGALFLFYASKILKLPKIIPHFLYFINRKLQISKAALSLLS